MRVLVAPARRGRIDLPWLLKTLGRENVTSLLVEGGGETNALWMPLCQRVVFFYAPLILGGRQAPTAIAGEGVRTLAGKITLRDVQWRRLGGDLLLIARVNEANSRRYRSKPMFTGIVEESGCVQSITPGENAIRLAVRARVCGRGMKVGRQPGRQWLLPDRGQNERARARPAAAI